MKKKSLKYFLFSFKIICVNILLLSSINVFAQNKTVTGSVIDEKTGDGIPNVSVKVQGSSKGTSTDSRGSFSLQAKEGDKLDISSVGYKSTSVEVDLTAPMQIKLTVTNQQLTDVVVVGYGTKKRSDLTGAVSSVSKERLSQLPVTNALQAIQGSVTGVTITQSSSVPGSSSSALVRGAGSLAATTEPFIVVDGVPFIGGSLNDINPSDIASIDILKDVSSTAVYGTRGANGVILITTKKGRTGKASITYNVYAGVEGISHKVEPMNGAQYVQKYADWKAQAANTSTAILPNAFEQVNYANNATTDWLDQVTRGGNIQNHTLSISGGSKDVRYYVSGDYLKQNGVIRGYQYNRASIRTNVDATVTSFLNMGINVALTGNNYDGGRANLTAATQTSPYGTFKNAAGDYEIYPMFGELLYTNPMLGLNTTRKERTKNIAANIYAELSPGIKGLKFKTTVALNYVPTLFQTYVGRKANSPIGNAQIVNSETNYWLIDNLLTYEKSFDKHRLDFTALYSAEETRFNRDSTFAANFINDVIEFNNLGAASITAAGSFTSKQTRLSQMLRVNYGYDSRYLLTLTARRDGASVFGSNTSKYAWFPSVALAWNANKEKFLEKATWLNNLKLRFSYGLAGNQGIAPYGSITSFGTTAVPYNGLSTVGLITNVLGNNNLTWESTIGSNFGIDFSILKNKISGSIETYSTKSKDLLVYRSLPTITGYTRVLDNLGVVSNKGIELSLKTQNLTIKDFRWETSINFSSNKNKIVELYGDGKDDIGNRWFIGKPISVVYDYKLAGIWQVGESPANVDPTAKPGDLKFEDLDGSKTITADDRMILGQSAPKWIGGLTNTFHYKNFHLNVFIQTVQGVTRNNSSLDFRDLGGRQNLPAEVGYWTSANASNTRPSLTYNNSRLYGYASDASYTRLKDVTLSYVAGKKLLEKTKLGGITFYMSGRNLGTWTKWVGWDPEADFDRTPAGTTVNANNTYPVVRTIIFGANFNLR
jgi:TonB-linked SusC/RagA family outer membrane protein